MAFICSEPCIVCGPSGGGDDSPFLNLSSEAPDVDIFIGRAYTNNPPPLGKFFYAAGCIGFCFSSVSQAEADLCAMRQNAICNSVNNPGGPTTPQGPDGPVIRPPSEVFPNQRQVGVFACPDGTQFTFTVEAGAFFAPSTAQANAYARSYANNQATRQAICLSGLSQDRLCEDVRSTVTFIASNVIGEVQFAVLAGALPPGMSLISNGGLTGTIFGIPNATGDYHFTIGVTDQSGGFAEHDYTLSVIGISTSSPLPNGRELSAYSQAISIAGSTSGAVTYSVTGALPSGITINSSTGVISGTPALGAFGGYQFSVNVTDDDGTCSKNFSLTVDQSLCNEAWTQITQISLVDAGTFGSGGFSGGAAASNVHAGASCGAFVFPNSNSGSVIETAGFNYTGPGCNCCVQLDISYVINPDAQWFLQITQNGGNILTKGSGTGDVSGSYPITLAAGTNSPIQIQITAFANSNVVNTGAKSVTVNCTFGDCP